MCCCYTKQGHWRHVLNDDPDLKACIGGPVPNASTVAGLGVLALVSTPDRRQSKPFLTVSERRSKIARNSVFDCHLSPVGRQMAIKNSVSNFFIYVRRSINVYDCLISGVVSVN